MRLRYKPVNRWHFWLRYRHGEINRPIFQIWYLGNTFHNDFNLISIQKSGYVREKYLFYDSVYSICEMVPCDWHENTKLLQHNDVWNRKIIWFWIDTTHRRRWCIRLNSIWALGSVNQPLHGKRRKAYAFYVTSFPNFCYSSVPKT